MPKSTVFLIFRGAHKCFLAEMKVVVVWKALNDLAEPHYHNSSSNGGRPCYQLATMLPVHLMRQCYEFSDLAMVKWVPFTGKRWPLTSLTPDRRKRVRSR